jgi:hypothetical protein
MCLWLGARGETRLSAAFADGDTATFCNRKFCTGISWYQEADASQGGDTMGIVNSNKVISANQIDCDGTLKVTIALTAAPDIVSNPTDIALVLDRSGSMEGSALANMKAGAKKFIDIIEEATAGVQDGVIGSGSHIGIVSFATTATADTQLITSVATLKSAVDALSAGGNTNHADAFTKAMALFDPASTNHRVIVMLPTAIRPLARRLRR